MLREPSALVHPAKICPNMRRISGSTPYHPRREIQVANLVGALRFVRNCSTCLVPRRLLRRFRAMQRDALGSVSRTALTVFAGMSTFA